MRKIRDPSRLYGDYRPILVR